MASSSRAAIFRAWQPRISLVVRLAAGVIMVIAGWAKAVDLPGSVRAVRAYELLPESLVPLVGNLLPFAEIVLGLLLIMGIFTRYVTAVYLAMILAFTFGVIWAWSTGLTIDCGCFGAGGEVAADQTNYPGHLLERTGFLALGVWLFVFPRSVLSLDAWRESARQRVEDAQAAARA